MQFLLVTFCNQSASPQRSGGLLALDADGYSWLDLDDPDIFDSESNGLCGACRVNGDVVLATQSTPPLLILYDPVAGRIKAKRDLSPVATCIRLSTMTSNSSWSVPVRTRSTRFR